MNFGKQLIIQISLVFTVSACTITADSPTDRCVQIGCEDGLQFYPHEEFSAVFQHRRFYGVNGVLPEDLPWGSPERAVLRQKQIEKLRSMGLDAYGRPLNQ
jgi:hypothetical protein